MKKNCSRAIIPRPGPRRQCWRAVWLALLLGIAAPAAPATGTDLTADFAAGLQAFDGGDLARAAAIWRALAAEGNADAMNAMAGLHAQGTGVPRDRAEAARWYRRAAEAGHLMAAANLGDWYVRGDGLPRERVLGLAWLSVAAARGHRWAALRRDAVSAALSPAERDGAAALAESIAGRIAQVAPAGN